MYISQFSANLTIDNLDPLDNDPWGEAPEYYPDANFYNIWYHKLAYGQIYVMNRLNAPIFGISYQAILIYDDLWHTYGNSGYHQPNLTFVFTGTGIDTPRWWECFEPANGTVTINFNYVDKKYIASVETPRGELLTNYELAEYDPTIHQSDPGPITIGCSLHSAVDQEIIPNHWNMSYLSYGEKRILSAVQDAGITKTPTVTIESFNISLSGGEYLDVSIPGDWDLYTNAYAVDIRGDWPHAADGARYWMTQLDEWIDYYDIDEYFYIEKIGHADLFIPNSDVTIIPPDSGGELDMTIDPIGRVWVAWVNPDGDKLYIAQKYDDTRYNYAQLVASANDYDYIDKFMTASICADGKFIYVTARVFGSFDDGPYAIFEWKNQYGGFGTTSDWDGPNRVDRV